MIFSFQPVSVILVATIHLATHLKWLTRPHVPADTLYPAPIGQNVSLCPLIGRWLLFWHKFQVTRALCQCSHLRTLSHCLQNKKTGMKIWVKVGMIKPKRGCLFYNVLFCIFTSVLGLVKLSIKHRYVCISYFRTVYVIAYKFFLLCQSSPPLVVCVWCLGRVWQLTWVMKW